MQVDEQFGVLVSKTVGVLPLGKAAEAEAEAEVELASHFERAFQGSKVAASSEGVLVGPDREIGLAACA